MDLICERNIITNQILQNLRPTRNVMKKNSFSFKMKTEIH